MQFIRRLRSVRGRKYLWGLYVKMLQFLCLEMPSGAEIYLWNGCLQVAYLLLLRRRDCWVLDVTTNCAFYTVCRPLFLHCLKSQSRAPSSAYIILTSTPSCRCCQQLALFSQRDNLVSDRQSLYLGGILKASRKLGPEPGPIPHLGYPDKP